MKDLGNALLFHLLKKCPTEVYNLLLLSGDSMVQYREKRLHQLEQLMEEQTGFDRVERERH